MPNKVTFVLLKIFTVVAVLAFINVVFILFFPEVYTSNFSIPLILFNIFLAVDKAAQPFLVYGQKEKKAKIELYKALSMFLLLFMIPFIASVPYLEYSLIQLKILSPELIRAFWALGILMIIIGGSTMCTSRIILGRESSIVIGIEKDHKLVTKGPYHIIRHPIYTGSAFLFLGYALSFSSMICSMIILLVLVLWLNQRIQLEEKLLIDTFGDEYRNYMKRTKRIIPFIY
ncbi:MAG: isoprenylcysteine carboxylmethyltransferase family protein [Candidatus Heimdallarchaeota archaeon]|nr:isoprenylcysteine carboxylmethyltransferase family protein [Candidatus Heimdallarchaeota archaeon]